MAQEALGKPQQAEKQIQQAAAAHGHDGFMPEKVAVPGKNGLEIRGNGNPPSPKQRGRVFIFKPTGERVTVTREKVGVSYEGVAIHEVTARNGNKFLASIKQLVEPNQIIPDTPRNLTTMDSK